MKLICKKCASSTDFPDSDIKNVQFMGLGESIFYIYGHKTQEQRVLKFHCSVCAGTSASIDGEPQTDWAKGYSVATKLFDDPTPNGQINTRVITAPFFMMQHTILTQEEKENLFNILLLIGKKLAAVWKHKKKYIEIEDSFIGKAKASSFPESGGVMQLEIAQDLFIEWDEFLVQLKSSLDYLVKFPVPILGRSRWTIKTFGEKGELVIKALRQNTPAEIRPMAKAIGEWIIKKHQPWLSDVIDARDRVNHLIGEPVNMNEFVICKVKKDAKESIRVPMWNHEQTVRGSMEAVWDNLLRLFEDFIVMFLYIKFDKKYAVFHGAVAENGAESPWKVVPQEIQADITSQPGWTKLDVE